MGQSDGHNHVVPPKEVELHPIPPPDAKSCVGDVPERQSYMDSLYRQTRALVIKNLLLAARNPTSTALRLISSFVFVAIVFLVDAALTANQANNTNFQNLVTPDPQTVPGIPPCVVRKSAGVCYTFAYVPAPADRYTPSATSTGLTGEVERVTMAYFLASSIVRSCL